jgi:hypothetical protein
LSNRQIRHTRQREKVNPTNQLCAFRVSPINIESALAVANAGVADTPVCILGQGILWTRLPAILEDILQYARLNG